MVQKLYVHRPFTDLIHDIAFSLGSPTLLDMKVGMHLVSSLDKRFITHFQLHRLPHVHTATCRHSFGAESHSSLCGQIALLCCAEPHSIRNNPLRD